MPWLLGELVAHAAHGEHQLGLLRVALDLLAQVGDVDVAGADVARELRLPQLLHDLQPAEHLPGSLREQPQHLELRAGQVHGFAPHRDQVPREVDCHRAGFDRLGLVDRGRAIELAPAQLRPHASDQLAHRERLRDVVVGSDLEADDRVDLGVLGGQQDDRYRAAGADVAADVEAAAPGHHDVEDQQVEAGLVVAELYVGVLAVHGQGDVEALLLERVADGVTHRGLVVRDQDPVAHSPLTLPLTAHSRHLHSAHATGVAAGFAAGSRTQNVLPAPSSDSTPIRPPITSTIRFAIASPSPNPS